MSMAETTEYERAQIMDSPTHDLDFLMRLIRDANRLQRAEELLKRARPEQQLDGNVATKLGEDIDNYFGGRND